MKMLNTREKVAEEEDEGNDRPEWGKTLTQPMKTNAEPKDTVKILI